MAAVFLAEHIALRRRVALKILHPPPDAEESGNYAQRFRLEAETLATLDHPNIVTLYDYGEAEDSRFFLAMEYIDGPRYTDILSQGALAPDRTIQLILQVCGALRYAHKRGVIHRDLKPSNLLIRNDPESGERVKVVDFGLVKVTEIDVSLTREGLVLGSPHCMAPEQVRGSTTIDARADIYAIGILLFRSLTGAYPFHASTSTATMVAHLNEPIPSFASMAPGLVISPRLEPIVRKCLAKSPADRYADVAALMDELTRAVGYSPDLETQSASRERPKAAEAPKATTLLLPPVVTAPPPTTTRQPVLAFAVVAALALVAVLLLLTRPWESAPSEAPAVPVAPIVTPPPVEAPAAVAPPEPPPAVAPTGAATHEKSVGKPAKVPTSKPPVEAPATKDEKPPEGYMPLPDDFK
jgi:serine/threonine-protein kinase